MIDLLTSAFEFYVNKLSIWTAYFILNDRLVFGWSGEGWGEAKRGASP